nr:helix-turn-helix domain-containing protein [Bacteroidales bacterium]
AVEDNAGNLWIATQGGLNRLNPQTGSLISFPYDRIGHPMRFNEGQPILTRNGDLYFNTSAGILYFNPQEISNSDFVPELLIQAFYVSGTRVPIGTNPIRINPSDGIRVQFAAIDLTAPEQILYSYKLDGRDKEWVQLGNQATVSIPPLRAGKYTLRIRSTNGNGLEVDNEQDITLLVRNTFFHSGWAGILYLLAVSGVVYLLARPRKRDGDEAAEPGLYEGLHGDDRRFVESYLAFLDSRLDDGTLDVPQMCEALSVSRSVLFEKCRTLLGTTPAILLRHRRLEKAKELIREGGRTMAEISYATGFNDPHYFSRIFKQETGMTPTEYRSSLRKEAAAAASQPATSGNQDET